MMEFDQRRSTVTFTAAMRKQPLYMAIVICMVMSIVNLRGSFFIVPADTRATESAPWNVISVDRIDASKQLSILLDARKKNAFPKIPLQQQQRQQPLKNETIIVGLANKAYVEVAILWYRRMMEAGFTTHRILAADMKTASTCDELDLRYDNLTTTTKPVMPSCPSFHNRTNEWDKKLYLFAARWIYVREKLKEGYHVLLTDVDAVYNDDTPLSTFEALPYDHIASYADKMPASVFLQTGFTICGCFNWIRSTPSMIQYLDLFLSNCGCTKEKNVNGQCKCGCDDQVTMNSMLFYQLDVNWDPYNGTYNGEFLRNSMTGVSQRTGHRIKILDRGLVYRGHKNNTCNSGNWITFPKSDNATESKLDQMKRLLGNCPLATK